MTHILHIKALCGEHKSTPAVVLLDKMYVCTYCRSCHKSLAALILCVLASCVNSQW